MITGKQLEGYDRDGVVFPIKVLTTEEVTFFREAIEGLPDGSVHGIYLRM